MNISIYTLNARDNFFLEFVKGQYNLSDDVMHHQIIYSHKECIDVLNKKGIKYPDLKKALTPNIDRNEIILAFDTLAIESAWYGKEVFDWIIPLFDRVSNHSVLTGDYIDINNNRQDILRFEFLKDIIAAREIIYQHSTQFYIVYINNLADLMVEKFNSKLKKFPAYIGYFNVSNQSFIKNYASTILAKLFLKNGPYIIQGHEDDWDKDEDLNMCGYSFEENGFKCKSIACSHYDLFLSYKIERAIYPGFELDTTFSLNTITSSVFDITDFDLIIEEPKFKYILEEHGARLKKAGIINLTIEELKKFIAEKINSNYIYNMMWLEEYRTLKFNVIVEATAQDSGEVVKLLLALEYIPHKKNLRLITMF